MFMVGSSIELSTSVVIPTYNRAALITETLDRVFRQTRIPHEVIVVNDGSTDDTRMVLERQGDRIRVVDIANSGDLVARNVGLGVASGQLVAFCDSDDLWQPDHLALMASFWEGSSRPLVAYSDFREVHDEVWSARSKFEAAPVQYWNDLETIDDDHAFFGRKIVPDLLSFQPFFPSCMVVDRERFIGVGGWDEGASRIIGCDFATVLALAEHPPIGVLRRATVGIRKHAGNLSGNVQRMNLGDADVLTHVLASRPSFAAYSADIRRSIEARRFAAFNTAFAEGNFVEARRIGAMLGPEMSALTYQAKTIVTRLPARLRTPLWRGFTWLGARRSNRRQ